MRWLLSLLSKVFTFSITRTENSMRHKIVVVLLALFSLIISNLPAVAQTDIIRARPLITSPIDNSVRATVPHSTHRLAQPAFDQGHVNPNLPMERMILALGISEEQEHGLRTFLDAQQTVGSVEYHHWLTPEVFGQRFGPHPSDIQQVRAWLEQQGFRVGKVARSGRWMEFSGTDQQVEAAFHTEIRRYQVGGKMHIANAIDISLPTALTPVVRGVVSLHDFFSQPRHVRYSALRPAGDGTYLSVEPAVTGGNGVHALSPGDFAKIYDTNQFINGPGIDGIGIVARSDIKLSDVQDFSRIFSTSAGNFFVTSDGPNQPFDPNNPDAIEATLDAEWAATTAPFAVDATLVVGASTATTDGVDIASAFIVDQNLAPIISVSFGQCEQLVSATENNFISALWQQAAAQGISVIVASGDDGAAGCDDPNDPGNRPAVGGLAVSGLASTPYNTAVGGTQFNENGNDSIFWSVTNSSAGVSALGYIPENVWNDSCDPNAPNSPCAGKNFNLFASGGGASTLYAKPSWQAVSIPGVPNDGKRDLPDVSLNASGAHDPYLICFNSSCSAPQPFFLGIGGTSASAPSFAGIMAIVNHKLGGRQGLANYVLYKLAAQQNSTPGFAACNSSNRTNPAVSSQCVFNDVTVGNNSVPGLTGFTAGIGYDLATGLGSVDANNLVNAWSSVAFQGTTTSLQVNGGTGPVSVTHGQSVTFSISVHPMSGTGTPTGNVSLISTVPFASGTNGIGGFLLDNTGSVTGSVSNMPGGGGAGADGLTAHYSGDGSFAPSDSNAISITVSPENSSTSLVALDGRKNPISSGSSIAYASFVAFRIVVTGASGQGFADGQVILTDSGSDVVTVNVDSSGQAEIINCLTRNSFCLAPGGHSLTARFAGDNNFNPSGPTAPVALTVTKGTPGIVAGGFGFSQIQLSAQIVTHGTIVPTGTVQFFDGGNPLGSAIALSSFQASMQTTLSPGSHIITAQYSGDNTYNSATSAQAETIAVANTAIASQTVTAGQTATYNLTLNASNFQGQVSFACTGAPAGATCTVNPAIKNLTGSSNSVPVTVTVTTTTAAFKMPGNPFPSLPFTFAGVFAGLLCTARRRGKQEILLLMMIFVLVGITSCGGGGSSTPPRPPTNSTLTLTASSGSLSEGTSLGLTINH